MLFFIKCDKISGISEKEVYKYFIYNSHILSNSVVTGMNLLLQCEAVSHAII